MKTPPLPRLIAGVLAAIGLVFVLAWVELGKASLWPAVVLPS